MTAPGRSTLLATLSASLLVSACQGAPTAATRAPTGISTSPPSTASASPPASQSALLSCPTPQPLTSLAVLAHTDISPDDLLALADGSVWVSDPDSGRIEHLAADGPVLTRIADQLVPEGMVAVGGSVVLAEQATNRLVRFTPPDTRRSVVLTLPSRGAAEGIDGIGADPTGTRLLIPDSAHGTLLSAATDGTDVRTLASGLGRDVDAAFGPDGAIWVAVEAEHGLLRVAAAGGSAAAVGGHDLTQLDDVVAVGPLLYATSITTNEVMAIDPATGADRVLVTGGHSLQGLALLADGRLAIADSPSHLVATLAPCGAA